MKNNIHGLTLIEVLIALVIISVAYTAILIATSQTIRQTHYLENKITANWVGMDITHKIQSGSVTLPESEKRDGEETLLKQQWHWQAELSATPNPAIQKLTVQVFGTSKENNMIRLISYVYRNRK